MSSEPKKATSAPRAGFGAGVRGLLQLDDGALCFELLFDLFGFLFGDAFFHRPPRLDQILGLFQAQARDRPYFLDDLDLLVPAALQHDGKLALLLDRRSRRATRRPTRRG